MTSSRRVRPRNHAGSQRLAPFQAQLPVHALKSHRTWWEDLRKPQGSKAARGVARGQAVCKPGSVPAAAGDGHSSGTPVAGRLARPTRAMARKPACGPNPRSPLRGLAPGGVCPAVAVAGDAVRSYRTLSPLPIGSSTERRSALCGTFPRVAPAGRYPAPCFRGARTFLPPRRARRAAIRPPDCESLRRPTRRVKPSAARSRAAAPSTRRPTGHRSAPA